jgi:hypothetical protein
MEKILMNDVINLVKESIKRGFKIECSYRSITIYNKEEKEINIIHGRHNDKEVLVIRTINLGKTKEIELSEEDLLKWKLLEIECDNYQNDIALKDFNSFFEEDNNIPKDINDLDNDEE